MAHAPTAMGEELFARTVFSAGETKHGHLAWSLSVTAHVVGLGALLIVPLFLPDAPPVASVDYIRVLIYDPPPPPPPPLPKGNPLIPEAGRRPRPSPPETRPEPSPSTSPRLEAPIETPPSLPDSGAHHAVGANEPAGSPTGSESGVPEGMEEGVEGGVVGGIPGGVVGGVIGGTGRGPVPGPFPIYDQPPRALRLVRPQYPQDAFVKKIEGTVMVEFVIGADGRVASARVVSSVAPLDAAALQAVRQWVFTPAFTRGRPVASLARAPVSFRIF